MGLGITSVSDLRTDVEYPRRPIYVLKRLLGGTTNSDVMSTLGEPSDLRWRAVPTLFPDKPTNNWSSFDRTPWKHPWLTRDNLADFRRFSDCLLAKWFPSVLPQTSDLDVAFVGNMANLNYTRLAPLRRTGVRAPLYLHPDDQYVLGQPGWEEFDGDSPFGAPLEEIRSALPSAHDVFRLAHDFDWQKRNLSDVAPFLKPYDLLRWPSYASLWPLYNALSKHKVLVASQCQYAAYFSGRPYVFGRAAAKFGSSHHGMTNLADCSSEHYAKRRLSSSPIPLHWHTRAATA